MAIHRTILLVESNPSLLDAIGFGLRRRGYHVLTALDGERAAELVARNMPDAVVLDMFLPKQSGFQIARLVKERSGAAVPVVMLSHVAADAHHDYAIAIGIDTFLVQPKGAEVVAAVEALCPLPLASQLAGSGALPWSAVSPN